MSDFSPQKSHRRIGLIAAIIVVCLIVMAFYLQHQKDMSEAVVIAEADAEMSRAVAGDCPAFERAQRLYFEAMRMHLQSKDLAAKTGICASLSKMCALPQQEIIAARKAVIDSGTFQMSDVEALALAQLAAGDKAGALITLARMPEEKFCRWLSAWLRELPKTVK